MLFAYSAVTTSPHVVESTHTPRMESPTLKTATCCILKGFKGACDAPHAPTTTYSHLQNHQPTATSKTTNKAQANRAQAVCSLNAHIACTHAAAHSQRTGQPHRPAPPCSGHTAQHSSRRSTPPQPPRPHHCTLPHNSASTVQSAAVAAPVDTPSMVCAAQHM
jgi:hypothetical protein